MRKAGRRTSKYVNASEIGTVQFCPNALYNQLNGVKSSKFNQSQRMRGDIAHEQLSNEVIQQQDHTFWLVRLIRWLWRLIFR